MFLGAFATLSVAEGSASLFFKNLVKNPLYQDIYQEEFISISSSLILSHFHPSMNKDEIMWYVPKDDFKVGLST